MIIMKYQQGVLDMTFHRIDKIRVNEGLFVQNVINIPSVINE